MSHDSEIQITSGQGFNERARRSLLARQAAIGEDLEQDEVGRRVAAYMGEEAPIKQTTVSRWLKSTIPDLRTIAALALVLDVDPGWLAFGDLSRAPRPPWFKPRSDGGDPDVAQLEAIVDAPELRVPDESPPRLSPEEKAPPRRASEG